MNRISMVSIANLVELTKKNNRYIGEDLDYLTNVFESGMTEVLKEVALKELVRSPILPRSDLYQEASTQAAVAFGKLYEQLNEEQKSMLMDVEAAYNFLSANESEEHFIQGYIKGYKFIKQLNESCQ